MILVLYFKDTNDGIVKWIYLDHFSKEIQDFFFVRAVWYKLLSFSILKKYKEVYIWSDGGPAHFKIAKTLYFFFTLEVQYEKKFQYNFFASFHGHSLCDSHTGNQKLILYD